MLFEAEVMLGFSSKYSLVRVLIKVVSVVRNLAMTAPQRPPACIFHVVASEVQGSYQSLALQVGWLRSEGLSRSGIDIL